MLWLGNLNEIGDWLVMVRASAHRAQLGPGLLRLGDLVKGLASMIKGIMIKGRSEILGYTEIKLF